MPKDTRTYDDRREYFAKATSKRRNRLKKQMVQYKGGCCQVCGYSMCLNALDFHHIDPSIKSFNLSKDKLYRSWKLILKELDKCVMVCANCHREIHAGLISLSKIGVA